MCPCQIFVTGEIGGNRGAVGKAGISDAIVCAATLSAVPWANGGGVTRVIADRPEFRLSLATIAGQGPFSILPDVTRQFAVVAGQVELSGDFAVLPAILDAATPPFAFPGDLAVHAVPHDGPVLALNLIVPIGAAPLRLERCEDCTLPDAIAVFACTAITVGDLALHPHDTLFPAGTVHLSGPALVVR